MLPVWSQPPEKKTKAQRITMPGKRIIALEYYHKWAPLLSTKKRLVKLE